MIEDVWINSKRWTSHFDGVDKEILKIYEKLEIDNWNYRTRWSYSYDNNGNLISELEEDYESFDWVKDERNIYSYNENGYLINAKAEQWEDSLWFSSKNASLNLFDSDGNSRDFFGVELDVYYAETTEVEFRNEDFSGFFLSQNYPNPFNPTTTINYSIPNQSKVVLKVYDILGNEIAELVNKEQLAGSYSVKFNARNLSSGIYIYTLKNNQHVDSKKLMVIK